MKAGVFIFIILFLSATSSAQNTTDIPFQSISTDSSVVYRLFATKNIYTFIKLNTRNGQMWQVQWSTDANERMVVRIYLEK